MKRKNLLFVILFFSSGVLYIFSDDGSWSKSFSVQAGSIYSEVEHPDITLEKELLVFDGEKTTAVFLFRNTSNRPVTVECGFPVRHEIETYDCGTYLEIPSDPYGGVEINALSWFETTNLFDPAELDEPAYSLPEGILLNDFNNSREFIDQDSAFPEVDFSITQDGKSVSIRDVLLERHASRLGAALTYHFRHDLVFGPGQTSLVRVEYRQDLVSGGDGMSDSYKWDYVIGTGATWKGTIGSFLLLTPAGWTGELPGLEKTEETDGMVIYGSSAFEPSRIDTFRLHAWGMDEMTRYVYREETYPEQKKMWITGSREVMQDTKPVQDFVNTCSASSFLPDRINVFNAEGVIDSAGFGPPSAFDGLGETSWCEGSPDDGIGEYLECRLTVPVWAVTVKNGFTRFPARDWMFERNDFERYVRDDKAGIKDYFSMNNRVRTLKIAGTDGETRYTLDLKDQRDEQTFSGIFLSPGIWRFSIDSVYSGSRWKDTCLAELRFIPEPEKNRLWDYLKDSFFRENLAGIRF